MTVILERCQKIILNKCYDLILCFIDLDKLKSDYPKTWQREKSKLEKEYPTFTIIWQIDNAEDEYKQILGDLYCGKHKLNKFAQKKVEEFINSDFWKRILKPIKDKERILDQS